MNRRKNVNITENMLNTYQEHLQDEEKSPATVEKYLRDIKMFMEYLGNEKTVEKEKIREYKQELKNHYKISSVNSMLVAVNSFFVLLGREDLKVKLFKIQRSLYCKPEREMTEKDYKKLVETARKDGDQKMSMLLQTIGSTGIRISELKFITVESLRSGRAEIYNKGKPRVVLLPEELTRLLKKYCRKAGIISGNIFITKSGCPLDRSNISKKMKQLARKAGVDENRVFPHNFRYLFARI